MKLILASQGFTTPDIAQATAELAGKPLTDLNVVVINESYTAIVDGRDQKWLINELSMLAQYVKGTIAFVNLRAYDADEVRRRLDFADVVYIVGGKQIILPRLFRETRFDDTLRNIADSKVLFGTSAGANVLGKQIEDVAYWKDQYGSSAEYLAEPTLGLVDFNILPHFERADHPRRNAAVLTPLLHNHAFPLYGVTDTQAVIYDDSQLSFVGGTPARFGQDTA